jgi:hypothetical protein
MRIASRPMSFPPYGTVILAAGAAFSLLLATAAPSRAGGLDGLFSGFSRHLDRGGRVAFYEEDIAKASGPHVISGDCMSACTLWLGYRHSCVEPDAVLWFHAVSWSRTTNPWANIDPDASEKILNYYPPRLRAFLKAKGWMERPDYNTLSGVELARLGVPLCNGRVVNKLSRISSH